MNNSHTVDGRIGAKGAEKGVTRGGKEFIRFSLANNSFSGGQEKTVWYDVTCYDPFIIENKLEKLKKGTWVSVQGTLDVDSRVSDNKVWINMNLTAFRIDIVNSGSSGSTESRQTAEETPSVYTGGTKSDLTKEETPKAVSVNEEEYSTGTFSSGTDDLPF